MSRRRSDRRGRPAPRPSATPQRPVRPGREPARPPLREQLANLTVRAAALLPLRVFFGVTFLYAGFDKLLDPTFFDPTDPASINGQMAAFVRDSPIGGLVHLAEPFAVPIGLLIALVEIAIGIGALTGLAFRVAAVGGAVLSLLFWLTASWATRPFYYGADLPYAIGWLTLAIAGTGGLLVPRSLRTPAPAPLRGEPPSDAGDGPSTIGRRLLLQSGILAAIAVAAASMAIPLREGGFRLTNRTGGAAGGSTGGAAASPATPGSAPASTDIPVATIAAVDSAGSASFTVPFSAPSPLPAGDPGIIVRLPDGSYVAFDAVCTHAGCTVGFDAASGVLLCPCHDATFDPAHDAAVLGGPTDQPLSALPIVVDPATGRILLRA